MSSILEGLRSLIEAVVLALGYTGLTIVMFVENIFPPIPSEVVLPFAGFLVAQGQLFLLPVLLAATLGTLFGALFLYYLGRWWGEARTRYILRRYGRWALLGEDDLTRALTMFRRHERSVIFWARLLPGVRSLISLPAGVAHMPLGRFLIFTTLGTLVWNGILCIAGMWLGQNWTWVLELVDRYEVLLWVLLGGVVLVGGVRRIGNRLRSPP